VAFGTIRQAFFEPHSTENALYKGIKLRCPKFEFVILGIAVFETSDRLQQESLEKV
jgi:hypothetical protein